MSSFSELWDKVYKSMKSTARRQGSTVTIPRDHIDENKNGELNFSFKKDEHYFQVMINEMYLANEREWLNRIQPVVYAVTEFLYNKKRQTVPFLVGPGLLKDKGIPDASNKGIIIKNRSITGIRPYKGDGLDLTVVLCQTQENIAKPLLTLLSVIEDVADALDFSPALTPYSKVAEIVMGGFQKLFESDQIVPIIGLSDSYGPKVNIAFRPSYFALIDEENVDPGILWVKDRQLMVGSDWENLKSYRRNDYVLYSFGFPEGNKRDDIDTLPFYQDWEKVREDASSPLDKPNFRNAEARMSALSLKMYSDPDLTMKQADELTNFWDAEMRKIHNRAKGKGPQGAVGELSVEEESEYQARVRAMEILTQ